MAQQPLLRTITQGTVPHCPGHSHIVEGKCGIHVAQGDVGHGGVAVVVNGSVEDQHSLIGPPRPV